MFNRFLVKSVLGESFLLDDLSFLYLLLLTAELISCFCITLGSLGNMLGVTIEFIILAGLGVIV